MYNKVRNGAEAQAKVRSRQAADQPHRQFDVDKARQHIVILHVFREVRANTHGEQVAADNRGELQHRIAQQVAGKRARDQFVGKSTGSDDED